jgi:hypothetical protein
LEALTASEKETVIDFFSKYPVYENRIDWNSSELTYGDFEKVFLLADNSRSYIKRKSKTNPELLFKVYNSRIVSKTKDYLIIMPLDWECAVFFCSFDCGGTGAKWCIGDEKNPGHWNSYVKSKIVFYFIYFMKDNPVFGRKTAILYNRMLNTFNIFNAEDKYIGGHKFSQGAMLGMQNMNLGYTIKKSRDHYRIYGKSFSMRYDFFEQYCLLRYFGFQAYIEAYKELFSRFNIPGSKANRQLLLNLDNYGNFSLPEEKANAIAINSIIYNEIKNDIATLGQQDSPLVTYKMTSDERFSPGFWLKKTRKRCTGYMANSVHFYYCCNAAMVYS